MKITEIKFNTSVKSKSKKNQEATTGFGEIFASKAKNSDVEEISHTATINSDILLNTPQEEVLNEPSKKDFIANANDGLKILNDLRNNIISGEVKLGNLETYQQEMKEIENKLNNYDVSLLSEELKEIKSLAEEIRIRSAIEMVKLKRDYDEWA